MITMKLLKTNGGMAATFDRPDEVTILSPTKTQFRIDVFLQDLTHLYEAKETDYGFVYSFTAHAYTYQDHQRLFEAIESAKVDIDFQKGSWSRKVPDSSPCTDKTGAFSFSQLFSPKVVTNLSPWELEGKQATVTGYLRDDPTGKIYLCASYVDVYDKPNGIDDYEDQKDIVSDEFDW
jgi:hypothetical protein